MLALLCMWIGISVPLVFVGYYFGYRKYVSSVILLNVAFGIYQWQKQFCNCVVEYAQVDLGRDLKLKLIKPAEDFQRIQTCGMIHVRHGN